MSEAGNCRPYAHNGQPDDNAYGQPILGHTQEPMQRLDGRQDGTAAGFEADVWSSRRLELGPRRTGNVRPFGEEPVLSFVAERIELVAPMTRVVKPRYRRIRRIRCRS